MEYYTKITRRSPSFTCNSNDVLYPEALLGDWCVNDFMHSVLQTDTVELKINLVQLPK
jgi:hypothetical protein